MLALWEALKEKKYFKAFFNFLKLVLGSFSLSTTWGFNHLNTEIQKLDLGKKTSAELKVLISQFEKALANREISLSDLTDQTFLMSLCKDRILELRSAEKGLPPPSPYDKMLYHLHTPAETTVGKVLLFNRWGGKKQNQNAQNYLTNKLLAPQTQALTGSWFQHAALISKVESDGTLYITHANQKGVIEEKLSEYLARGKGQLDVMGLDLPQEYASKVVEFAQSKLGSKYDALGMMYDTIAGARKEGDEALWLIKNRNDMFYCSELIFSGLQASGYEIDKKLFAPWDFLKVLKPHYCSSLDTTHQTSQLSFQNYRELV